MTKKKNKHQERLQSNSVGDNVSKFPRRDFFKWGVAGAASAVTAAIGYRLYSGSGNTLALSVLPDAPITQADVDREYAEIYKHIAQAKKAAEGEGKNLVILCGEAHTSRNSLLLQLMVADIVSRPDIRIKDSLEELDQSVVARDVAYAAQKNKERDATYAAELRGVPAALKPLAKQACHIPIIKKFQHSVTHKFEVPNPSNTFIAMVLGKDMGIRHHGVDVMYNARLAAAKSDDEQGAYGTNETKMLDEIASQAQEKHCFGYFGVAHIPEFCVRLPERGIKALGIDCSAGIRLTGSGFKGISRQRIEELDRNKNIYKPSLISAREVHPSDAVAMTLRASLKHRLMLSEVTADEVQLCEAIVDKRLHSRQR